jgi:hypothetical protein
MPSLPLRDKRAFAVQGYSKAALIASRPRIARSRKLTARIILFLPFIAVSFSPTLPPLPAERNERRDAQRGGAKEYSALGKILAG